MAPAAIGDRESDHKNVDHQHHQAKSRERLAALLGIAWSRRLSGARWVPLLREFLRSSECPPEVVAAALTEYVCRSPVPSPLLTSFLTEAVASGVVAPFCFYALLDHEYLRRRKLRAGHVARLFPAATAALPAVMDAVHSSSPDATAGIWVNVIGLVTSVCRLGKVAMEKVAVEANDEVEGTEQQAELLGTTAEIQEVAEQTANFLSELVADESLSKFVAEYLPEPELWRELQSALNALRTATRAYLSNASCNTALIVGKLESRLVALSPGAQRGPSGIYGPCGVALRYILHQLVFVRLSISDEEAVRRLRRVQMLEGYSNVELYFHLWVTALRELRLCGDITVRRPDERHPWYRDMRPDGPAADARLYRTFVMLKLPQLFKHLLQTDRVDSVDDKAMAIVTETVLDRLHMFPNLVKPRETDLSLTVALQPAMSIIPNWEDLVTTCRFHGLLPAASERHEDAMQIDGLEAFECETSPCARPTLQMNLSADDVRALYEMATSADEFRQLTAYRRLSQTLDCWTRSMDVQNVALMCCALEADARLVSTMVMLEGTASLLAPLERICNDWTIPEQCELEEQKVLLKAYGTVLSFMLNVLQRLPGTWLLREQNGFLFRWLNRTDFTVDASLKSALQGWIHAMFGQEEDLAGFALSAASNPREIFTMLYLAVGRCLTAIEAGVIAVGDFIRGVGKLRDPCLQFAIPGAVSQLSEKVAFLGTSAIFAVEALRTIVAFKSSLSPEVGRLVAHLAHSAIGGINSPPELGEIRDMLRPVQKQDTVSRPLCHLGDDSIQLVRRAFRSAVRRDLAPSSKPLTDMDPRWGEELFDLEAYPRALRNCAAKLVVVMLIQEVLASVDVPQVAKQTVELAASIFATDWSTSVGPEAEDLTLVFLRDVLPYLLQDLDLSYDRAVAVGRTTVCALVIRNFDSRLLEALDGALLLAADMKGKFTPQAFGLTEGLRTCPRFWEEVRERCENHKAILAAVYA